MRWPALGAAVLVVLGACGREASSTPARPSIPAVPPASLPGLGPQGRVPQFVVECGFSHAAPHDPIVHPGHPGRSHLHTFFGNTTTHAGSTYDSLLEGDTTCDHRLDRAAYWAPALHDDGRLVEPDELVAYYRVPPGSNPSAVEPYPPGLMIVAGDATATEAQPLELVNWSCGTGSERVERPPTCPEGRPLRLHVVFPECWDGERADSDDHRSHMAYAGGDGGCPDTHPVLVPQLEVSIGYPITGPDHDLSLASGSLASGHADFFNAWEQDALEKEVTRCLRRGVVCGVASGGN